MYQGSIVFVYDNSLMGEPSARWTSKWPVAALSRAGYVVDSMGLGHVLSPTSRQKYTLKNADVIFYERHVEEKYMPFLEWAAKNSRLMYLLDDAHWAATPEMMSYKFWHQAENIKLLEQVAAMAEKVICPNKNLAAHFPNGHFKPNRPDFGDPAWSVSPLFGENVIFWGGSEGHIAGMKGHPCLAAVRKLVEIGVAVFVAVPGSSPILKQILTEAVPGAQITTSFFPYSDWLKALSGCAVSLCPLGSEYDQHRSWIKALESSAAGTVWVGSDGPVYEDCMGGVRVGHNEAEWYKALRALILDQTLRKQLWNEGMEWAWKQGIQNHLDEWEAIFNAKDAALDCNHPNIWD